MKTLEIFNKHTGNNIIHDPNIISAMQEYAEQYAKEALRLASENARVMTKNIDTENELEVLSWTDSRNVKFSVSKQSILSENNLPKHI